MDLRGRFGRKHDEGEDRGRRGHRPGRHRGSGVPPDEAPPAQAGEGAPPSSTTAAPVEMGMSSLSRQSSATSGTVLRHAPPALVRHQSIQTDGRTDERRSFTQKMGLFRPHSANSSRNSSTNTSSSSLRSLGDQSSAGARLAGLDLHASHYLSGCPSSQTSMSASRSFADHSNPPSSTATAPPLSPLAEVPAPPIQNLPAPTPLPPPATPLFRDYELPVYPNQSYSYLQHHIHPTRPLPALRSRSSYPSHHLSSISTVSTWNQDSFSAGSRTAGNTPISSPGLFSTHVFHPSMSTGESYLHPTHLQEPKETHTVEVDRDMLTGNKLINDYEILDELGRGQHGKVKLGRHLRSGQKVAIKIVQRYSKRRRLGKLGNPEDKVKKEVAILKKARHPNVVSLLEVIDDPDQQKVYIVLEFVENGEIIWRKKGLKEIVTADKRRLTREKQGLPDSPSFLEECQLHVKKAQIRRRRRNMMLQKRKEMASIASAAAVPAWSLEHGGLSDDEYGHDYSSLHRIGSAATQEGMAFDPSPSPSLTSVSEIDRRMMAAVEGSMYGAYSPDPKYERRLSTASSNLYQSSDNDWLPDDDETSYVPFLTMCEARHAFRDAVLGLEYLHYQGIIHRDIKPANLLVTCDRQVKISDFGVSYLGRPIRDDDEESVGPENAMELDDARELSKTVGTPAFYAPELCYTGNEFEQAIGKVPKITGAIDVWSLGVTLYGMVFGRLPFVADDEFSLFQNIVKHAVFIPSKRLKAVEAVPSSTPASTHNLPVMNSNKRTEDELVYEDIDDELRDLLLRLLEKDPTKRITLREIKHHPWVLRDVPDPNAWVVETDPGFQSKGKKIEVSTEEVTRAVTKVPLLERVKSSVAKWTGFSRKRGSSSVTSVDTAHSASSSSGATLGKESIRDYRRSSLRGDEETLIRTPKPSREGSEHPLSQSQVVSPDLQSGSDYFTPLPGTLFSAKRDQIPRPGPPERAASSISTAESAKTVQAGPLSFAFAKTETTPTEGPQIAKSTTTTSSRSSSSSLGGLLGGARRIARSLQRSDSRRERSPAVSEAGSVDSTGRSHPVVSIRQEQDQAAETPRCSTQVLATQTTGLGISSPRNTPHRRSKSQQYVPEGSAAAAADSFRDVHRGLVGDGHLHFDPHISTPVRPMTSPPSAVTISSSSADDSGFSNSASHPSIPSVVSGASSLSGDGLRAYVEAKESYGGGNCEKMAPLLRTGDTVTAYNVGLYNKAHHHDHDDESRYDCDDENEEDDDYQSDDGICLGRRSAPRNPTTAE